MPTRTIKGNLDRLQVGSGADPAITYLGVTASGNVGDLFRAFRVTPTNAGSLIVRIDRSDALLDLKVYQESNNGGTAPTGYFRYFNVAKAGKGKGAVAITAGAGTAYVVLLTFDEYSNASYTGSVTSA